VTWPKCNVSIQVEELGRATCPGCQSRCHVGSRLREAMKGEWHHVDVEFHNV